MADQLANAAADECRMSRHRDYDLSNDDTQPFKDKFWFLHTIQVQTAEGPVETKACIRDLDDSLRNAVHDNHKLGQSKQDSLYFQLWDKMQTFRVKPHSDALWTMPSIPDSHKRNIFKIQDGSNLKQEHSLQETYAIHAWAAHSQGHTLPTLQR